MPLVLERLALSNKGFLMTTSTSSSLGLKLGRGLGYAAAATVHGASVAVTATGQFGADVVAGTAAGYTDHSARLAALRAQTKLVRPASIAIKTASKAKATA